MPQYDIEEAQKLFEDLIEQVLCGTEIILSRAGKPVAKLVKIEPENLSGRRQGGQWRGKGWISPDFDDPDPEIERMFTEGPIFPKE